ncbi:1946_t:CDS:2 [Dentiscutata erythropus]|uniref:1946_t:CDS:1 n=1 Tax=Dentiscutata erythropus TaxID=1348616 RepID=A0A9N9A421_9GLOM|nr:1946_t:CDS:2 [Dentiscutata erythropus]
MSQTKSRSPTLKDAFKYVSYIKQLYQSQPSKYRLFISSLKSFDQAEIDHITLIRRMETVFQENSELMDEFIQYCPQEWNSMRNNLVIGNNNYGNNITTSTIRRNVNSSAKKNGINDVYDDSNNNIIKIMVKKPRVAQEFDDNSLAVPNTMTTVPSKPAQYKLKGKPSKKSVSSTVTKDFLISKRNEAFTKIQESNDSLDSDQSINVSSISTFSSRQSSFSCTLNEDSSVEMDKIPEALKDFQPTSDVSNSTTPLRRSTRIRKPSFKKMDSIY